MRKYRFGKFSEAVHAEILSYHNDYPRIESSAKPVNPNHYKNLNITRIGGQFLDGNMIHHVAEANSRD